MTNSEALNALSIDQRLRLSHALDSEAARRVSKGLIERWSQFLVKDSPQTKIRIADPQKAELGISYCAI